MSRDTTDTKGSGTEPRDTLASDTCLVCGEECVDSLDDLEDGESYEARICVDESDGDGGKKTFVHLTDDDTEKTPQQEWEEHNEPFHYEPPQNSPEAWPSDAYTELWDRAIRRETQWVCQECNKPLRLLEKARRHVEKQHSQQLLEQAKSKIDDTEGDTEDDTGSETDSDQSIDENQTTLGDTDLTESED